MFVLSLAMADAEKAANLLSVQWQNDKGSMIEQYLTKDAWDTTRNLTSSSAYEKTAIKNFDGSSDKCTKIINIENSVARSPGRGGPYNKNQFADNYCKNYDKVIRKSGTMAEYLYKSNYRSYPCTCDCAGQTLGSRSGSSHQQIKTLLELERLRRAGVKCTCDPRLRAKQNIVWSIGRKIVCCKGSNCIVRKSCHSFKTDGTLLHSDEPTLACLTF